MAYIKLPTKAQPQKDQTEDIDASVVHHVKMSSGPMPSPEVLEDYDKIVPGAAERILVTFEKETEHRQSLERQTNSGAGGRQSATI